jgi:general secretion pathway protein D
MYRAINTICLTLAMAALLVPANAFAQQTPPSPSPGTSAEGTGSRARSDSRRHLSSDADATSADALQGKMPKSEGKEAGPESATEKPARGEGKSGKGGGVQTVRGSKPVSVQGSEGFEPILAKKLDYPELPDEGEPIDFPAQDTPLTDFLSVLSDVTGWNVIVTKSIAEETKITFWFHGVKPKKAMEILKNAGIYYSFDEDTKTLSVMTVEEQQQAQFGALEHETFKIRDADVTDMEQIVTSLMSSQGKMISDPRTGSILVWDTKDNIQAMRNAVKGLDVPLKTQAFTLAHVQAEDMLESVENVLTERGSAQADPRTNTIIVSDLPARLNQIQVMIEELDRKLETRTWTLNYIEPETAQERLEDIIPEEAGTITSDEDTHQLSITALPERLAEADELIKSWDIEPAQVQIEAYLVTASTSVARDFGINWSYFDDINGSPISLFSGNAAATLNKVPTNNGQRFSIGSLPYRLPLRNPITGAPVVGIDPTGSGRVPQYDPEFQGGRISAVIDYLDQQGKLTILSKPRITVRDGMEASFENTEEIPYQNTAYSSFGGYQNGNNNNNGAYNPYIIPTQIQKEKVGTILKVLPRITAEGTITMEIQAEDSTAEIITIVSGGQPSTVPQVRKSSAKTEVLVNNGQTLVLGGLRSGTVQDDVDRVPVLGDVPMLGRLFKTTKKKREDRDLLVFLTPTVVSGYTPKEAERLANIDAAVAEKLRSSLKPFMERLNTQLNGGKNEVIVAIGGSGTLYFNGELVTVEGLGERLKLIEKPAAATLVIRRHPNAPEGIDEQVAKMATDLGMKVVRDNDTAPFVPTPAPEGAEVKTGPEAAPPAPVMEKPRPPVRDLTPSDIEVTPLPNETP